MFYLDNAMLCAGAIHRVGNKSSEDGCIFSKEPIHFNDALIQTLTKYFLTPFHSEEYYHFHHDTALNLNEVYTYVSAIFENRANLFNQSLNLAKHLYENSEHPNIKAGDFYTIYFENIEINGETVDAVGLFKSENRDTFLRIIPEDGIFTIESEQGINIKKLDKGCIIFNIEREQGYIVAVVDNTNRNSEAQYWIEDFLHVNYRQDDYQHTRNIMAMTKNFVMNELPEQFTISRSEQAAILNDSVRFFKEKENFTMEEFSEEVIQQPEVIESFQQYRNQFQRDNGVHMPDEFDISESAVKKQARNFKSVIKLDKNFHIYIHGNENLIEHGEDEQGKFYKIYYKEEF